MRFVLLLLVLKAFFLNAQSEYPKTLFRSPLDVPILLSGTFGELRSNHFHSGIDIKTQQREGLSILAVGDGYISRIKVSPWGFGKALYISHADGTYTSVYAHLKKFAPEIEQYVKKLQYNRESYELEIYPKAGELPVKQGSLIAYSGNTGGSAGPHLHFELRDAAQRPINPLHFGLKVIDTKKPTILGVYGFSLNDESQINQSNIPIQINVNKQENDIFLADPVCASGSIGFGIQTYDGQNYTNNKNGVYEVEMFVNGTPYFSYNFEKFSFNETRYINSFIDYKRYKTDKQRVQKCFISPKNPLSIYHNKIDDGILQIKEGLSYTVVLKIKDFKGNISIVQIPVVGKKEEILQKEEIAVSDYFLRADIDNNYTFKNASVYFPKNAFYENLYINFKETDSTLVIHNENVPVHKNFNLQFDTSSYSKEVRRKLFIARIDEDKNLLYSDTVKKGVLLSTKSRDLGTYILATDTIAPKITALNFKNEKTIDSREFLRVKIEDIESGIANYRASINGKWILMEYEPKEQMIFYNMNDIDFKTDTYQLKVIVTDNVGNNSILNNTLYKRTAK